MNTYCLTGHNITAPPPLPPIQHMVSRWDLQATLPVMISPLPPLAQVRYNSTSAGKGSPEGHGGQLQAVEKKNADPTHIHVQRYCEHKQIVTLGWRFFPTKG